MSTGTAIPLTPVQGAERFRRERADLVAARNGPVPLVEQPVFLLHVIPLANDARIDVMADMPATDLFRHELSPKRFNLEGRLYTDGRKEPEAYGQLFTNGSLEVAQVATRLSHDLPWMPAGIDRKILIIVEQHVQTLEDRGIPGPFFVALTIVGNKSGIQLRDNDGQWGQLDREEAFLEHGIIDADRTLLGGLLPLLDSFRRSFGFRHRKPEEWDQYSQAE